MKTRIFALLLALALLAGCAGGQDLMLGVFPAAKGGAAGPYDRAEAGAAAANFAVRLLQNTQQPGQNALVSPFSVWSALGMTQAGAAGDMLAGMSGALGLPPEALGAYLADIAASLPDDGCLHSANGIWLRDDPGLTVEEDFLQFNADTYRAAVRKAPFDAATADDINAWVNKNTAGHIDRILDSLPDAAQLVLVNALAFDAEWEDIYTDIQSFDGTFTAAGGAEQPAKFLHSSESVFLRDGDAATGFLKYYAGRRYAFAVLLPAKGTDAAQYAAGLTGERLAAALANADTAAAVYAVLPKFTASGSYTLNEALSAMGMADAFDAGRADFSSMGHYGSLPLYIGLVLHRTELVLDERGTKAGAATAVLMEAGSAMVEHEVHDVVCDRPFVYMLLDTEWNLPLFIGTVETLGAG